MVLRKIGEGRTDANGRFSVSYTGTGAGKLQLKAVSGSLQSEIYELFDTKWYDLGTDSNHSCLTPSSSMTVTYGREYCALTETTIGTAGVIVTDTSHYIQPNDIFEFDFLQVDGLRTYATMYIRNKANGISYVTIPHLYDSGKQTNTWIHYKCQIIKNKLYVYIDDSTTPIEKTLSGTDTDYRIYFNTPTDITEIRFKNLKVY